MLTFLEKRAGSTKTVVDFGPAGPRQSVRCIGSSSPTFHSEDAQWLRPSIRISGIVSIELRTDPLASSPFRRVDLLAFKDVPVPVTLEAQPPPADRTETSLLDYE